MSNQKQLGFNAVQLALLLFLAAFIAIVLFPILFPCPGKDPEAACESNEKQIGLALLQYDMDYDNFYPTGTQQSVAYGRPQMAGVGWAGQLYPYTKSTGLYACPSDRSIGTSRVSYALNANLIRSRIKPTSLTDPHRTIEFFEVGNVQTDVTRWDEGASKGATQCSPVGDGTALFLDDGSKTPTVVYATGAMGKRDSLGGAWLPARHEHIANYLMADGHVQRLKPDQVSTGESAAHSSDLQTGAVSGHAAGTANGAYAATFSTE